MTLGLRPLLGLVATILVLGLLLVTLGPAACNRIASEKAQNRMNTEQSKAQTNSAADAIKTQGEANRREVESETLTRANEKEIRDAEGADVRVAPDAHAAGVRALCRRRSLSEDQRRRLRCPDPAQLETGR